MPSLAGALATVAAGELLGLVRNRLQREEIGGKPNPAMVPLATEAITELCRNSSRVAGLVRCTSISGAVRAATASRNA